MTWPVHRWEFVREYTRFLSPCLPNFAPFRCAHFFFFMRNSVILYCSPKHIAWHWMVSIFFVTLHCHTFFRCFHRRYCRRERSPRSHTMNVRQQTKNSIVTDYDGLVANLSIFGGMNETFMCDGSLNKWNSTAKLYVSFPVNNSHVYLSYKTSRNRSVKVCRSGEMLGKKT